MQIRSMQCWGLRISGRRDAGIFCKDSNWNMMKQQTVSDRPTFRHDLFRIADLAEEVAKIFWI